MQVLGIDPGSTIGWAVYDSTSKRIEVAGQFRLDWYFLLGWVSRMTGPEYVIIEFPIHRYIPSHASEQQKVAMTMDVGALRERARALASMFRGTGSRNVVLHAPLTHDTKVNHFRASRELGFVFKKSWDHAIDAAYLAVKGYLPGSDRRPFRTHSYGKEVVYDVP